MLYEVIDMIELKITPNMIRHIIKEKERMITTEQAEMFLNLFGQQIEDALRDTLRKEVRKHYE
tara:strand:- start:503 stop:691 length:189 start_codon:yes stop_codon:yes gene_type:complete